MAKAKRQKQAAETVSPDRVVNDETSQPAMEKPPIAEEELADIELLDIPSYYANNMRMSMGPYDVRLIFGEFLPASLRKMAFRALDVSINTPRATIVMSHQHFKSMLDVMQRVVEESAEKYNLQDIYYPSED